MRECFPQFVIIAVALFFTREAVLGIKNWARDGEAIRSGAGDYYSAWGHRISMVGAAIMLPSSAAALVVCLI